MFTAYYIVCLVLQCKTCNIFFPQTAFLEPNKKSEKKLRDKLHVLYGNLDTSAADPQSENLGDIPGVFVSGDFYPYVYFDINTSFIEAAREL